MPVVIKRDAWNKLPAKAKKVEAGKNYVKFIRNNGGAKQTQDWMKVILVG